MNNFIFVQLPQGSGPRAIVVTPYWQSGEYVAELFHDLTSELKVIHTYGGGAELEKRVMCEIKVMILIR